MKKTRVLKRNKLPSRLPITTTLTTALALDYWNAPMWLWGALGVIFLLIWITALVSLFNEEEVDIKELYDK